MPLTFKERELVNIGASVATGCKPCTDYHFEKVRQAGATDEEIRQAISDAMVVRDSARVIMESHGLQHLGIQTAAAVLQTPEGTTRMRELVSVAAAFAVNCTSNLKLHLAAARSVQIGEEEIHSVLQAATFIRGEAVHYVGEIIKLQEENVELQELLDELKRTQAQLVQAKKMAALGKLVAAVVHEMNTPVGALNSSTDMAGRALSTICAELQGSSSAQDLRHSRAFADAVRSLEDNLPIAKEASARISRIVGNLKSFVRLDEAALKKADLHRGLQSTLALMRPELEGRISVVQQLGELPDVTCFADDLNQVFMNLISNAAQAIRDQGTITISTRLDGERARIEIADTGAGIPPEQMEGLFDPDISRRGTRVKAGLGLFTCHHIVQRHLGQIEATSELGRGSTFTVVLPLDLEKKLREQHEPADAAEPAGRCDRLESHQCDRLGK